MLHNTIANFKCYLFFKCLENDKFNNHENETVRMCLQNPIHCEEGFSLSIFYQQPQIHPDYLNGSYNFEREYLVSTGNRI